MNYFALILVLFLSITASAQSPFTVKPKPAAAPPEEIHDKVDEPPQFPGGPEAMQKYLEEHMARPAEVRGVCNGRKLVAGFVVEKDGSLSRIDIVKSIEGCPDFEFDVLRIIKSMPKWAPAKINGRWVRCYYKMPVYIS